jgi:hypothetical protein
MPSFNQKMAKDEFYKGYAHYWDSIFSIKAEEEGVVRPKALVQRESKIQETRKIRASQAVNFFKTSAVEVPKRDSLASPPKEAPKPELLLSCIKITPHNKIHRNIKSAIAKK